MYSRFLSPRAPLMANLYRACRMKMTCPTAKTVPTGSNGGRSFPCRNRYWTASQADTFTKCMGCGGRRHRGNMPLLSSMNTAREGNVSPSGMTHPTVFRKGVGLSSRRWCDEAYNDACWNFHGQNVGDLPLQNSVPHGMFF